MIEIKYKDGDVEHWNIDPENMIPVKPPIWFIILFWIFIGPFFIYGWAKNKLTK